MAATKPHVIVVGAGIIGATIAWYLVRNGARVTIIDAREPGGVATPCSFCWINSTYGFPKDYFDLRVHAMAEWSRLAGEVPGLPYHKTGTLYLHLDGCDGSVVDLEAFAKNHSAWGYDIRIVGPEEIRAKAPNLRAWPELAAFAPEEGVAEGTQTARLLVARSLAQGATLRNGQTVERLEAQGGRVSGVVTSEGLIAADEIVISAGAATPGLTKDAGYEPPLTTPAGLMLHTKPHPRIMDPIILAKDLHVRQRTDGSILAGWDFGGGSSEVNPDECANDLIERIRTKFNNAEDVEFDHVTVGTRPTPADGFPIIGRPKGIKGLTVAVMHSGITLAPAVGAFVANEILKGERNRLLDPYGPDRFTAKSAHAAVRDADDSA